MRELRRLSHPPPHMGLPGAARQHEKECLSRRGARATTGAAGSEGNLSTKWSTTRIPQ